MKPDYNFKPGESELFPDGLIIDYKTTTNANPDEFAKTIYNFGYHNQAAFYQEGFLNIFGVRPPFILLPIEKNPPYECGFFMADEMMIKIGSDENRKLLDLYNDCYNNNRWPGYEDKLQTISLPAWIINKYNFEENVA
jgi:exodeoxyribonuclease VIII